MTEGGKLALKFIYMEFNSKQKDKKSFGAKLERYPAELGAILAGTFRPPEKKGKFPGRRGPRVGLFSGSYEWQGSLWEAKS